VMMTAVGFVLVFLGTRTILSAFGISLFV